MTSHSHLTHFSRSDVRCAKGVSGCMILYPPRYFIFSDFERNRRYEYFVSGTFQGRIFLVFGFFRFLSYEYFGQSLKVCFQKSVSCFQIRADPLDINSPYCIPFFFQKIIEPFSDSRPGSRAVIRTSDFTLVRPPTNEKKIKRCNESK